MPSRIPLRRVPLKWPKRLPIQLMASHLDSFRAPSTTIVLPGIYLDLSLKSHNCPESLLTNGRVLVILQRRANCKPSSRCPSRKASRIIDFLIRGEEPPLQWQAVCINILYAQIDAAPPPLDHLTQNQASALYADLRTRAERVPMPIGIIGTTSSDCSSRRLMTLSTPRTSRCDLVSS
ncbi:hypothetical protein OH77DRAFT_1318001 [Trametes cingulata]|nr:hypothetical protein OH77DRAFT_1318001 [Trametes cingulata]